MAVFVFAAWMIITLPIVGVFILDGAFIISDYLRFVSFAAGASLALIVLVMFPLALLLERLVVRARVLTLLIPLGLLVISVAILLGRFLTIGAFFETAFSWTGGFVAFSLVFAVYWSSLWLERSLIYGIYKLIHLWYSPELGQEPRY